MTKPRRKRLPPGVQSALQVLEGAFRRRPFSAPPAPESNGDGLVVASYNIHKCVGVDGRFDPGRIAAVIEEMNPDILALQEADRRFGQRHGLLDAGAIERRTGLALVPVSHTPGGHGWRGNALLIRDGGALQVRRLALPGAEPRGALVVDVALPEGVLRVATAHLGLLRRHRVMQAAAILAALDHAPALPTLLMGDLNEWRPDAGSLAPLEPLFGPLSATAPSFPSRRPFLALDRILGHPAGLVSGLHVHDTPLARIASDHLPLMARLRLSAQDAAPLSAAA